MATKTDQKARITIESDGELMFWIKFDGKIIDLVMLSELKKLDLDQKTLHAIDEIYDTRREQYESK
jgi:hypothetical protein